MASKLVTDARNTSKLSLRDKIIMTYCKLKQNVSYNYLSLLFNAYTAAWCREVFFDTVQLLSATLEVFLEWPGREELRRNIPKCFEDFMDVAVVLDCNEIFIQHPSNLSQQIITYSNYKHDNTFKIMTGVSPAGNLIYRSPTYGGRVSGKAIFENSNVINLLVPGDAIMVDRGYLIDKMCDENRVKLVRPPFLGEREKFTKEEALLTQKIAAARIHVEKANQRLKVFKILRDTLPTCLFPVFDNIFTVICATVNLSSPILKDDKFMTK